ncbi:hypothetical protein M1271_07100 [Patescibacteria group bacterium]|nr:hypothetical protein [Patescibacteria group bacterium]
MLPAITALFFFLFPLFFLPVTPDSYEYNKMFLLALFILLALFSVGLNILKSKKITIFGSNFATPLFLLAGIVTISTLFQSPNIVVALTTPMATATIVGGFLLYLFLVSSIDEGTKPKLFTILVFDAVLISIYTILMYTGIFTKSQFTPAGTLIPTLEFLATVGIFLLSEIISKLMYSLKNSETATVYTKIARSEKHDGKKNKALEESDETSYNGLDYLRGNLTQLNLMGLSLLIIVFTVIFLLTHLFTDQKAVSLPYDFGWMIFLETMKNVRTLFLGIGPSNFMTAFSLGRSLLFNQTPNWNIIFTSSSSFLLTLATESGILAGLLYIFISLKAVSLLFHPDKDGKNATTPGNISYLVSLIFILTLQILFPSGMSVFILTMILLAFVAKNEKLAEIDLSGIGIKGITLFILLPTAAIIAIVGYFGTRAYIGEVYFKRSLDALVNNNGSDAFNSQADAIKYNPYVDRYHVAFSQTNLAIANSLSAKKSLTDQDKQQIPKLVQQSIDQGRIAISLYQTNLVDWNNMANIYGSLINYAKDSDKWAESTYQQIFQLDPFNPLSRLELGGIYLNLGDLQSAENLFRQAIQLKPDLANSHYNLAIALSDEKKYNDSYQELQTAMSLVTPNSDDAKKIEAQIKLLPASVASQSAIPQTNSQNPETLQQAGSPSSNLQPTVQPLPKITP